MNEDVMVASFDGDVEPILPEGWKEGDDIFAGAPIVGETFELDGVENLSSDELGRLLGDGEQVETPTTGENEETADLSAGEVDAETETDETQAEVTKTPRILKLRVNHEDREVDFNAMSDEDLIALAQQGYAFAAMRESQAKEKYRSVYQDQLDAGMTEVVARMVATHEAGKEYPLTDEEPVAEPAPAASAPVAPASTEANRDFKQQVKQLQAVFPGVKEMPESVMNAYMNGADLLTAYSAYHVAQTNKDNAALKKENTILKQNIAAAARAPVKGVTGSGDVTPKDKDPFERGWDLGNSW